MIRDAWFDFKLWLEYEFIPGFKGYPWLTFFAGLFTGIVLSIGFSLLI